MILLLLYVYYYYAHCLLFIFHERRRRAPHILCHLLADNGLLTDQSDYDWSY